MILIAALFLLAKYWKQPRCPSVGEWLNKLYIHTMEYYSAIKRNELLINETPWMHLKDIMLSEKKQS